MLKLIAPIIPHLAEEIWRIMYIPDKSIHISSWPKVEEQLIDHDAEKIGDLIISAISDIRREKNRKGVSLNAPIDQLDIHAPNELLDDLRQGEKDIKDTLKVQKIVFQPGRGNKSYLEEYPSVGFSIYLEKKP